MTGGVVAADRAGVRDVSDGVIVRGQGQVVAEGPPDGVMAQQAGIDAYLGAHHDAPLTLEEEEQQMQEAADVIAKEEEEEGTARARSPGPTPTRTQVVSLPRSTARSTSRPPRAHSCAPM